MNNCYLETESFLGVTTSFSNPLLLNFPWDPVRHVQPSMLTVNEMGPTSVSQILTSEGAFKSIAHVHSFLSIVTEMQVLKTFIKHEWGW